MKPADRARLVMQASRKTTTARKDGRSTADHARFYRGFVDVDYGGVLIRFYPLKRWVSTIGVVDQTLRTWLAQRTISAFVMHGMPVMCKAEMVALGEVAKRHNVSNKANTTDAFVSEARSVLQEVRLALDTLKRKLPMTDRLSMLISPSLKEGEVYGPAHQETRASNQERGLYRRL